MRHLADALVSASYRRHGWYDPAVLGTLHRMLGRKQVSVDAQILPPPWIENRLVGRIPLHGHSHRKRWDLPREPLELDPRCTSALYEMLDTFSPAEELVVGSGSRCDGARGSFST